MKRSTDRILTTHVGSLIRPDSIRKFLRAKQKGESYSAIRGFFRSSPSWLTSMVATCYPDSARASSPESAPYSRRPKQRSKPATSFVRAQLPRTRTGATPNHLLQTLPISSPPRMRGQ